MHQTHLPTPLPSPSSSPSKPTSNLYCILLLSLLSLLLILLSIPSSPSLSTSSTLSLALSLPSPSPPAFAYFLSASGPPQIPHLIRLLLSLYHPKNHYLLCLRTGHSHLLAQAVQEAFQAPPLNVHVVGQAGFVSDKGASGLASVLHGAAALLRLAQWDWFVNLDAGDYPLVKQDDLLHVFSYLPRDLNFVQHSSYIGWRESRQIRPIVVDPGLYLSSGSDIFYATQKRELPTAYKLFTGSGSGSVILSRKFIEYCILGTDNLPRTLLMYYANSAAAHLQYFQTVLCNSPGFNKTVVNNNLYYMILEASGKKEPALLTLDDFKNMTDSGAPFGTRYSKDDPVLDQIDKEILNRASNRAVPGGWCLGSGNGDPCTVLGSADVLTPGPRATVLAKFISVLLSDENFRSQQCTWN